MRFDTVIRDGTVVTASDTTVADVGIRGEVITAIGLDLPIEGALVIDAKDRYVLPGGVDAHTHLAFPDDPNGPSEKFRNCTIGAAWGGTTTVIDFSAQSRGGHLRQGLEEWHGMAEGNSAVDYAFHMIVTDLPESRVKEMDRVVDEGVSSFKLFMAYPGALMVDDGTIFRALLQSRENGGRVCLHAENGEVIDVLVKQALDAGLTAPKYHATTRPMSAEAEATRRAIFLSELAGTPVYIVHLSAGDALEAVREARERGVPVYAETCPQYLFLSEEEYDRPGFHGAKYVCSPPLRPKGNEERLWSGLATGDLDVISTDHNTYCFEGPGSKHEGRDDFSKIPNGLPSIESRLHLVHDGGVGQGRISVNRMVDLLSTSPAKQFGLYPKKGTVAVGSDADLVIFDPKRKHVISQSNQHMGLDYTPYEGREVTGRVEQVLLRGKVTVVQEKGFLGQAGDGKFIPRGA